LELLLPFYNELGTFKAAEQQQLSLEQNLAPWAELFQSHWITCVSQKASLRPQ